jgi:hypothetical protein
MLMGLQITALVLPKDTTPERQMALLADFMAALRAGR